ncbi:hypothetical protein EVAR_35938_1 [Eumeta japonica]|uniref:Uncharacterized protein n=1 Tax=Eumeta variegata TaxID=151549 RepID=A0A4C1W3P0_EUMVA|nr:hypothetical protein EVAR_35938_1 [Eumeta japonica]
MRPLLPYRWLRLYRRPRLGGGARGNGSVCGGLTVLGGGSFGPCGVGVGEVVTSASSLSFLLVFFAAAAAVALSGFLTTVPCEAIEVHPGSESESSDGRMAAGRLVGSLDGLDSTYISESEAEFGRSEETGDEQYTSKSRRRSRYPRSVNRDLQNPSSASLTRAWRFFLDIEVYNNEPRDLLPPPLRAATTAHPPPREVRLLIGAAAARAHAARRLFRFRETQLNFY